MLKKLLLGLTALVAVLLIVIALQPADFRVTRSTRITAAPEAIFAHVNDLHRWEGWSPWAKLDPNAKESFEGPAAGVGSSFAWAGNSEVGEGKMTIVESHPGQLVRVRLEFIKPMAATNMADFTFQPQGAETLVSWSMYGERNFIGKAFGLVMDCDKMLGGFFEKGLTQLKVVSENAAITGT